MHGCYTLNTCLPLDSLTGGQIVQDKVDEPPKAVLLVSRGTGTRTQVPLLQTHALSNYKGTVTAQLR